MNKDFTYFAYKSFLDSWIGSNDCVDFLKVIMPKGFCESIYDDFWNCNGICDVPSIKY